MSITLLPAVIVGLSLPARLYAKSLALPNVVPSPNTCCAANPEAPIPPRAVTALYIIGLAADCIDLAPCINAGLAASITLPATGLIDSDSAEEDGTKLNPSLSFNVF